MFHGFIYWIIQYFNKYDLSSKYVSAFFYSHLKWGQINFCHFYSVTQSYVTSNLAYTCIDSSYHDDISIGNEVIKINTRVIRIVTTSVVVENSKHKEYGSRRKNEFMGWKIV